jgi:hypothetical protein
MFMGISFFSLGKFYLLYIIILSIYLYIIYIIFYNFVEDVFWPFKLGIFDLFYTCYPSVLSSHYVLDFPDIWG